MHLAPALLPPEMEQALCQSQEYRGDQGMYCPPLTSMICPVT
jgi:hypothetical protein